MGPFMGSLICVLGQLAVLHAEVATQSDALQPVEKPSQLAPAPEGSGQEIQESNTEKAAWVLLSAQQYGSTLGPDTNNGVYCSKGQKLVSANCEFCPLGKFMDESDHQKSICKSCAWFTEMVDQGTVNLTAYPMLNTTLLGPHTCLDGTDTPVDCLSTVQCNATCDNPTEACADNYFEAGTALGGALLGAYGGDFNLTGNGTNYTADSMLASIPSIQDSMGEMKYLKEMAGPLGDASKEADNVTDDGNSTNSTSTTEGNTTSTASTSGSTSGSASLDSATQFASDAYMGGRGSNNGPRAPDSSAKGLTAAVGIAKAASDYYYSEPTTAQAPAEVESNEEDPSIIAKLTKAASQLVAEAQGDSHRNNGNAQMLSLAQEPILDTGSQ